MHNKVILNISIYSDYTEGTADLSDALQCITTIVFGD